jgi:site-specific recombinase XerC
VAGRRRWNRGGRPLYKATGNLRAIQILLGHTKIESTVRYLGLEVEDRRHICK